MFKYELPGSPELLVDLLNDDDVENMWDALEEHCAAADGRPYYKLKLLVQVGRGGGGARLAWVRAGRGFRGASQQAQTLGLPLLLYSSGVDGRACVINQPKYAAQPVHGAYYDDVMYITCAYYDDVMYITCALMPVITTIRPMGHCHAPPPPPYLARYLYSL